MKTYLTLALSGVVLALGAGLVSPAQAETTFRIALSAGPPSQGNPYPGGATTANFVWPTIYDSLTRIDNDGTVQPWLALSWQHVTDTEWHFKLRPGVTFSNGEPFNAAAVKATFDRLRTDDAQGYLWNRQVTYYPRVDLVDDMTVAIHTDKPNAMMAAYLTTLYFTAPAHTAEVGFQGLFNDPVGTGPFVMDRWGADRATFSANPASWNPPKVDQFEAVFVPDASARLQALETNQVDVAAVISTDQIGLLERNGHRAVMRNPSRLLVVALQTQDPALPLADVRVRQALNYAVNRTVITQILLADLVKPASQPAVPMGLGYDPTLEPYAYDPDKARQLLADAGYPDGFSFTLETVAGFMPNDAAILQQIASDLKRVGVNLDIRLITYPQLVRSTLGGELGGQALLADFFNNSGDALRPMLPTTNHACGGLNPWYCDEEIQAVIGEAEVTLDLDKRKALTQQVIRHYRDQASSLFLFPVVGLDGVHKRVTHWEPWNDILNPHLIDVEPR
ncbi:MAG: ABC transporter substrate-binding protein [Rhodospirillaceae bacterium]